MKLSVIMPAYNEGEVIFDNLIKAVEIIDGFCDDYEIIVVNDGSKDNTAAESKRAAADPATHQRVVATGYTRNAGKGGAIKHGVSQAKGDYIAFVDADLELCPSHLAAFLTKAEEGYEAIIGSKMHKDSVLEYPMMRRVLSLGYYILLKMLFRLGVRDTQTGIKLFAAAPLKKIIGHVHSEGFTYDIELLALIVYVGGKVAEMPVELKFSRGSYSGRIGGKVVTHMALETLSAWRNVRKVKRLGVFVDPVEEKA